MNRDPGFSSDFAGSNATTLMWIVVAGLIIAILSANSGYAHRLLELLP